VINGKTYYQILGVLEDAEDIVIRAAYKVLAQKYHPDKWVGSVEEANQKMSEINKAYEVLSNNDKRGRYDEELRRTNQYKTNLGEDTESAIFNEEESDWKIACEFFPDLNSLATDLKTIRPALENHFKAYLLETKKFDDSHKIYDALIENYLENYFGKDPEVKKFALNLVRRGQKQQAIYLNQLVTAVGSAVSSERLITKVLEKFSNLNGVSARAKQLAKLVYNSANIPLENCLELLYEIGFGVKKDKSNYLIYAAGISYWGMNEHQLIDWIKNRIAAEIAKKGTYEV